MKKRRARAPGSSVPMIDHSSRSVEQLVRGSLLGLIVLLAGCSSSPIAPTAGEVSPFGPAHVLSGAAGAGEQVIWGGRITAIRNLAEVTEISIVSYPLDRGDRPRLSAEPGVRFLVRQPGFLEPVQYAPGRYISVLGTVAGIDRVLVDEHLLDQPVLEAEQLHLWPADISQWQSQTRFSFGVGISL